VEIGGFKSFCEDLARNATLLKVNLARNTIADVGCVKLAAAITEHPTLKEINLELCEIGDQGSIEIMAAIGKSQVKKVSFKNNLIHLGYGIQKAVTDNSQLKVLDLESNDLDYKTYTDIMRMIDLNRKRHHEQKLKHSRESHIEVRALQRQLQSIRDQITTERGLLAKMRQEKRESQQKLKETEAHKIKRVGELEAQHRAISTGVSDLLDTIRDQRGAAQGAVQALESEVSVLSNRLARESDNHATERKALGNLAQRIESTKRTNAGELLSLRERLKDARQRYCDCVMMLTSAWQFAREQQLLKRLEEEQKAAEDAAVPEETGGAKRRKGSPKKGGRPKSKGKVKKGKGKGKKGDKAQERRTTPTDAPPVFETAPEL
jgi:hypothetical protein